MREIPSGELVGEAGGESREDGAVVEIGYWVRTDRTGRGYATAAAAALTSMAFDASADVARIEIRMDQGNARSRRVAERLGFVLIGDERFDEARLAGQTGRGWIWAIDRAAWSGRS
jgi:ribosomal-protein-serine acetyltransferase